MKLTTRIAIKNWLKEQKDFGLISTKDYDSVVFVQSNDEYMLRLTHVLENLIKKSVQIPDFILDELNRLCIKRPALLIKIRKNSKNLYFKLIANLNLDAVNLTDEYGIIIRKEQVKRVKKNNQERNNQATNYMNK